MEENKFCTRCGAELPEGATFCPECGSPIGQKAAVYPAYSTASKGGVGTLGILILIYGILAIIYGILDMTSVIGLTESSYNELIETISELMGMDMSELFPVWSESLPLMMGLGMAFMTVSGILAVACYYFCKTKNNWKISVILCASSSVACLGMCCSPFYSSLGVLLFVIGIVVTALLYTKRDSFAN